MSDVGGLGAPNAPCAIVPLNPNELSREPLNAVVRGTTSTGIWNGFDDAIDDRCAFSLHINKVLQIVTNFKHKRHTCAAAR
jgi:hypothetical protein